MCAQPRCPFTAILSITTFNYIRLLYGWTRQTVSTARGAIDVLGLRRLKGDRHEMGPTDRLSRLAIVRAGRTRKKPVWPGWTRQMAEAEGPQAGAAAILVGNLAPEWGAALFTPRREQPTQCQGR